MLSPPLHRSSHYHNNSTTTTTTPSLLHSSSTVTGSNGSSNGSSDTTSVSVVSLVDLLLCPKKGKGKAQGPGLGQLRQGLGLASGPGKPLLSNSANGPLSTQAAGGTYNGTADRGITKTNNCPWAVPTVQTNTTTSTASSSSTATTTTAAAPTVSPSTTTSAAAVVPSSANSSVSASLRPWAVDTLSKSTDFTAKVGALSLTYTTVSRLIYPRISTLIVS